MPVLNPFQQALILEPSFSGSEQVYQTHLLNMLHNVEVITPRLLAELLCSRGPDIPVNQTPLSTGLYDYDDCCCNDCTEYHCPNFS